MKLTNIKHEDLIGPESFKLLSQDDLLNDLVEAINYDLSQEADSEDEIYDTSEASVEISLSTDDLPDEAYSPEIIEEVRQLYLSKGWKGVTYKFTEEDDDSYASHKFTFFFPTTDQSLSV